MDDVILWAKLIDLSPTVASLSWPEDSYMYLERIPTVWLTKDERKNGLRLERFNPDMGWNTWERGRLFCESFELRWEKQAGVFWVVYVGASVDLPGFALADELDLSAAHSQPRSYYLWGSRVPGEQLKIIGAKRRPGSEVFVEFKAPRVLYYPVSERAKKVALKVCEYFDSASGALLYYRFQQLEEIV